MRVFFLLVALAALFSRLVAIQTTVNLGYSIYAGVQCENGITKFLGMRYAAPPVGSLRFRPPQHPLPTKDVQSAAKAGKWCIGTGASPNSADTSEDCLFLNVYTPSDARPDSKLPVFFFIQGGGFNANSAPLDGSGLIAASGHKMLVVLLNYRVGPYGFLTDGKAIRANNGLKDQRKALRWVQRHISKFGGNPDHVVIGGASAGAASVSLHMIANGGRNDGLFAGAAAESISFATVLTAEQARYQYDDFITRLGCNHGNSLACLQGKTTMELQRENVNKPYPGAPKAPIYMWNPVIDGGLITNLTYTAFATGDFIKVPLLAGDDTDGGRDFAPRNASALEDSDEFLKCQFPFLSAEHFQDLHQLYPNDDSTCPREGCFYRHAAAIYGEARYMCPSLYVSERMGVFGRSWNYRWNVEDPAQIAEGKGVPHTIEVAAIFGPNHVNGAVPASYRPGRSNARAVAVMQAYWTSFILTLDPNTYRLPGAMEWTAWTPTYQERMLFGTGGTTVMESLDAGLRQRCDFWWEVGDDIRQ